MSLTLTPDSPPSAAAADVADAADVRDPVGLRRPTDQDQFDAAVARNTRLALPIIAGVAILAALVMATLALVITAGKSASSTMVMPSSAAATVATARAAAAAPTSVPPIYVSVAGSNKLGPDGKMHDSFSTTDFAVKVGQPTMLRINNTDSGTHSITSAAAGVNITVLPGIHIYAIVAKVAGRFEWICVIPCDSDAHGWGMTHPGYMAGYITAT